MKKNYPSILFYIFFSFCICISLSVQAKTKGKVKAPNLASVSAIVVDAKTGKILHKKNSNLVMPIASITKMMTAMVTLDAKLSLKERIQFKKIDRQRVNNYFSKIRIGSKLKRADVIRIAVMASENLAASALGRSYPGGMKAMVKAMNQKAKKLGMKNTHFADSTGLSVSNVSTAKDLAKMVKAASKYALIKKYTTTKVYTARFKKPRYIVGYTNTNLLVRRGKKEVKLSKTGYLDLAGRCLVMQTRYNNKDVIVVLLDSFGKRSPVGDANRIKKWLKTGKPGRVAKSAVNYANTKIALYASKKVAKRKVKTKYKL